jgi:hypothetical protein
MLDWLLAYFGGAFTVLVLIRLYIRGKLNEQWYVTGRKGYIPGAGEPEGYEVVLKKGRDEMLIFRVKFERRSSANPDTTFSDQLSQARADAAQQAEALNVNERLMRDMNRNNNLPGGIT